MRTWASELEQLITQRYPCAQVFILAEIYEWEPHFRALYPENDHVQEKLRQTLQVLRESGVIEFVDDAGTYRRL